jgi:hypothetical protein
MEEHLQEAAMSALALAMAVLLAVPPITAQATPTAASDASVQANTLTSAAVPEALQQAFDLMKQPGFHPELLELLEIEVSARHASDSTTSAAGVGKTIGIIIGVWIVVALVVFAVFAAGSD